jgi:hypothetical protein
MWYTKPMLSVVVSLAMLALVATPPWPGGVPRASAAAPAHPDRAFRPALGGSWLVTYDVAAFGGPVLILLSFAKDRVMLETDSPGVVPLPLGPAQELVPVIFSNGHGAWEPTPGRGTFAYLYRKIIYQADGLTPFGTTRTQTAGTVSADGTTFEAAITIEFLDLTGRAALVASGTATGTRISVAQP